MELLYVKEHLNCDRYSSDYNIGFHLKEIKKGECMQTSETNTNKLLFMLEGEIDVSYYRIHRERIYAGEMIFLSCDINYTAPAETDVKYLILYFDNQPTLCEKVMLETLSPFCKENNGELNIMEIRSPMKMVLDSILFYLSHKIRCRHLFEAKQKEIFLILRTFYTKEEIARFLSPIINQDIDFKHFILKNYMAVKNVNELAELSNYSLRSFNRKFKQYFDDSPYNWILKQKAVHIKNKLANPQITIGEIIKEYGFSSPAHFTTYCKKQFGENPSKLRKELNMIR